MRKMNLRCRLGRHTWMTTVVHGEECVVCRDCGKDKTRPGETNVTDPPLLGDAPKGYTPR